ncbi:uncharacterized protein LOC127121351 [Lathyrus oleraceus]|uniref:uncharacterized protein LOC127121351 n=1 Tax=Pisum sativum TaxID=3888 RepID=UPI0021D03452|nr:uncharacterized protein LOC127121351 [Pisum sativum]
MYCASQVRPVNAATFMIANLDRISQDNHGPILVGGLVTMIANAIGLNHPLIRVIRPMNIQFCFNTGIIRNLGPNVFEFLINCQVVHMFTLPDHMTSVHDRNNWLYDLDGPPDASPSPLETPEIYNHYDTFLSNAESHVPAIPDAPPTDHLAAVDVVQTDIAYMRGELSTLHMEFHGFMDVVTENLDHIYQHFYSFAPPTSSLRNG